MSDALDIVILGLTISSSWGNGHATTYRALVRELSRRGHRVLFLERDVPWYATSRDQPRPRHFRLALYESLADLERRYAAAVRGADFVMVGSYVPQGAAVGAWATATARGPVGFYDIDTPVTLSKLARGECPYLSPELIPRYDLYLSFTGGPTLRRIERTYGARRAVPLYCSVDPRAYRPLASPQRWDLAYLGTYSDDRQPVLERLLLKPARNWRGGRFAVVGPQYPAGIRWPANVERIEHLPPAAHAAFYNAQRFTLNVTRADMVRAGWSPSVRLFEAAACGTAIISDAWEGLETFFVPGAEILVAAEGDEVLAALRSAPESQRRRIGAAARQRALAAHTAAHRAAELEGYIQAARAARRTRNGRGPRASKNAMNRSFDSGPKVLESKSDETPRGRKRPPDAAGKPASARRSPVR